MATTIKNVFTSVDASEYLGISADLIRLYCRTGRIESEKLGRDWIIRKGALDKFAKIPRYVGNPNFFVNS